MRRKKQPRGLKVPIHRSQIAKKWLFSYILVLLIPLLSSVFVYNRTYHIISQEVIHSNLATLNALHTSLDYRLRQSQEVATNILMDKRLREVTLRSNTMQDVVHKQDELIALINNYTNTMPATDVLVYIPELDYCITHSTANTLDRLSNALHIIGRQNVQPEVWRSQLSQERGKSTFILSSMLSYDNYNSDAIVYTTSSHSYFLQNCHNAYIYVSLPLSEMGSMISYDNMDSFLLLDGDGTILYCQGAPVTAIDFQRDNVDEGYQSVVIDGQDYICSYMKSTVSGYTYAITTPHRLFWGRATHVTTITIAALLFSSLFGIILSLLLLYQNYSPLQNTISMIKNSNPADGDEFELINNHIETLYNEQKSVRTDLSRQQTFFKENYLHTLLQGSNWSLPDNEMLDILHADFVGKRLLPVNIYIEGQNSPLQLEQPHDKWQVSTAFIIDNVLDEILRYEYDYIKTSTDTRVTFVFTLTPERREALLACLDEALERTVAFFEDNLQLILYCVVGAETEDIEDLAEINKGMNLAHSYQMSTPNVRVVHTNEYIGIPDSTELSLDNYALPLCEAVRVLSYPDALSITESLFTALNNTDMPLTEIRYYIFSLVHKMQGANTLSEPRENQPLLLSLMDTLTSAESLASIKHIFLKILVVLCYDSQAVPAKMEENMYERIEQYVQAHYTDPNLNLSQISESIGLSPRYISKLFRMQMGQSLPDYISAVRIQKAKDIMYTEDLTVVELAKRVGYTNVKTFRRAFQKIEKTNPGQYKLFDDTAPE